MSAAWRVGHVAETHRAVCFCGRRVRWHVDAGEVLGCANLCGIHARALQRRSLWSAVFSSPIIHPKESLMDLTPAKRAALQLQASRVADDLANEYGRSRVGVPEYSSADLRRDGWSILVEGMAGERVCRQVRVYLNGTHAIVAETVGA